MKHSTYEKYKVRMQNEHMRRVNTRNKYLHKIMNDEKKEKE
jgi:hypothetical protein